MNNPFEQTSLKKERMTAFVLIVAIACLLGSALSFVSDSSSAEGSEVDYERYYYNQMTDFQKQIYDGIDSATIENPEFTITVPGSTGRLVSEVSDELTSEVKTVFILYKEENLYNYWIGSSFKVWVTYPENQDTVASDDFKISLENLMTEYGTTDSEVKANLTKIKAAVSSYSAGIDTTSTFTKVQSIHSIVNGFLEYDHSTPETMVPRNIATAFLGGSFDDPASVVCEGYAKTFKAICDAYDVPCIIVTGTGVGSSGSQGHMWNQVLIDGKWYLVDCTWDDQSENMYSDFMLVGSETVAEHFDMYTTNQSHIVDELHTEYIVTLSDTAYGHPAYEIRLKADGKDCALLYYDSGQSIIVPYTPVKSPTETWTYAFDGWEVSGTTVSELPAVTGDETYVAKFSSSMLTYHITFKDQNGKVYQEGDYLPDSPVTAPAPTKDTDAYASYTFRYWSIDGKTQVDIPATASADATYIAVYEATPIPYTVTFKDYDGRVISAKSDYTYGTSITKPADPTREMTNTQTFTFKEWNTAINGDGEKFNGGFVKGDVTYYAIYSEEIRYYTVIFKDASGAVLSEKKYQYNDALECPSLIDVEWETEPPAKVTADATYTAKVSTVISSSGTVVLTSVSNSAKVSSAVISKMKDNSGGTFALSTGTISFDAEAVKNLIADQTIQVNKKAFSSLSESARSQIGNADVYEITFGDNDSKFSAGSATVTIPYKLASGQSAADVKLFSVDGDSLTPVECKYYDGNITFSTEQFSYYAIQIPDNSSSIVTLIKDNVVIIAILIFAIIGIALSYKFSKP